MATITPSESTLQLTAQYGHQVNCEVFGAWLSSGLDPDRLAEKLGRLLGQLTGRNVGGGDAKKGRGQAVRDRAKKRLLKRGVRGLFEKTDQDATGTVSQHDMKVN